ncbi:MAG: nitroreductase family protein [Chloroflexi bacterium]|nr:nitroreductase family protein [Chloroflexota bacterium]
MDLATVDKLLTTTHSVRKRLDLTRPVEPEIIERCIEIATHAPSGSNQQGWHFFVLTDAAKRAQVAEYYRTSWTAYNARRFSAAAASNDSYVQQTLRVRDSACIEGRPSDPSPAAQAGFYGSILPAAWSFMLALRARGLGAAWTTLHLPYERQVAELLGIPDNITQAALMPVAYFTGTDFKAAERLPARERTHWNRWGARR